VTAAGHRVLIVSPVRNEAPHLTRLARSVAAQTRPPDLWLAIDDSSTDGTYELLCELARTIPFMRVMRTPEGYTKGSADRHVVAAAPRAFNWALREVDAAAFTHIGKLDGDIELPEDYFERLLAEFDRDPGLGIGGGVIIEPEPDGTWHTPHSAPDHVRGALKLYRDSCYAAIGGVREHLGWDGVDEIMARMHGYETRSFDDLVTRHHRPCGTTYGVLRGRMRGGETYYIVGYSFPWVVLKSLRSAFLRPFGVSSVAFMTGWMRAAWRRVPRVDDPGYRRFLRLDERRRLISLSAGPRARLAARLRVG
jgi:glycosyltransferase involved in cell wall biosynthesis